ncbi:MAG: hypothetical protein QXM02_06825 [Thermoproteota archaeon]
MELECPICLKTMHVEGDAGSRHICPNCRAELVLAKIPVEAPPPSCFSCSFQEAGATLARAAVFGGIALGWSILFTKIAGAPIALGKKKREVAVSPTSFILAGVLTAGATKLTYDYVKKLLGWE